MNTPTTAEFSYTREFNAPREIVFNAFSTADALNAWWGPKETTNTVVSLDFRPGGTFHFKMVAGEHTSYGRFLFRVIQPHQLLEFTNAFADKDGNVIKAPFDIDLPKEILYRMEFTERDGRTIVHMTGRAHNASEHETEVLRSISDSMHTGFDGTFDKLDIYLNK